MSSHYNQYYDQRNTVPLAIPIEHALVIAFTLVLVVVACFFLDYYTLVGLHEMATFELSQLAGSVGLQGLGKARDWNELEPATAGTASSNDKSKFVRSYKEVHIDGQQTGPALYPGLLNAAGNLCFLNATLQAMASLPSLVSYLDALVDPASTSSTPVAYALLVTLDALNTPSFRSRPSPLRPSALATALANSSPSRKRLLGSSEQQDAQELWLMIKEAVEEEALREEKRRLADAARRMKRGLGEVLDLNIVSEPASEWGSTRTGKTRSWRRRVAGPRDPWTLLTSQRVRCMTCGYTREVTLSTDSQVPLSVPPVASCSLYDLLQEHTKTDLLSDYACRKCAVVATLDKYVAQRDRLASGAAPEVKGPILDTASTNRFDTPQPALVTGKASMTSSRKDRLRKTQKLVDKLEATIAAADYERVLGDDIKVEKVYGAAGKMIRFARTPQILTLHLQRSIAYARHGGAFKNSCQVNFPHELDLSPFADHPPPPSTDSEKLNATSSSDRYRLASLVVHYGSHHFGHYIAFRRRPPRPSNSAATGLCASSVDDNDDDSQDGEWYRISDETVQPASLAEALRNNPFLLFYERVSVSTSTSHGRAGDAVVTEGEMMLPRLVESWRVRRSEVKAKTRENGHGSKDAE